MICVISSTLSSSSPFTIMLDPAGDAKHTGRVITDCFERGITLQFCEELKKILEQLLPDIRVVLTRFPGETLQELQNASFANRLQANLYLSIHFYQEHKTKPDLFIYRFSYENLLPSSSQKNHVYPYDKAYIPHAPYTQKYADQIKQTLVSSSCAKKCTINGVYMLPFKPLIGITAPAIGIEIGLKHKDQWREYLYAIADSLQPILVGIS